MGRLKKYKTKEEKILAQRKWSKDYYWKNKEKIDDKSKRRYRKKVDPSLPKV